MEYEEVKDTIQVPANTGIEGFLHTIREILRRSGVQSINIDARGMVSYRRFIPKTKDGADLRNIGVSFEELQPSGIVRNANVEEVQLYDNVNASVVVGALCDMARTIRLNPTAFVSGADTVFWEWHRATTGVSLRSRDHLYGLPFLTDRLIPDTALLLCAGYGRDASFADTRQVYKVEMPSAELPNSDVEVIP